MPLTPTRRAALALALGLLAAPLATGAQAGAPMNISGATTVDANGVIELITGTPGLVILDNRREADYAAGHIEGAVRLIDTDITGPEVLADHGVETDTPVLFYCNGLSCGRAANAAEMALEWGFTDVHYYALGMDDWNELGLPVISH